MDGDNGDGVVVNTIIQKDRKENCQCILLDKIFHSQTEIMVSVMKRVEAFAKTESPVLLLGDPGTGKEVIASSLHNFSNRNSNLFCKINCSSLTSDMANSELFGHEKGSFTGAIATHIGIIQKADQGTFFLDEVGNMNWNIQARFLRFLENKTIRRVGANTETLVDVRVISATNKDLKKEVDLGKFRQDLYDRLSGRVIKIPTLSDRREDISQLANFFLQKYDVHGRTSITPEAIKALEEYSWPGNIRELKTIIESVVDLICFDQITKKHIENELFYRKSSFDVVPVTIVSNEECDLYSKSLVNDELSIDGICESANISDVVRLLISTKEFKKHGLIKILIYLKFEISKFFFESCDRKYSQASKAMNISTKSLKSFLRGALRSKSVKKV